MKAPDQCQWHRSDVYIANFDFTHCSGVSIVDFEQVNTGCNIETLDWCVDFVQIEQQKAPKLCFGVTIVNFEHILQIDRMILFLTLSMLLLV